MDGKKMKKIPYGMGNFANIILDNYYYVDKQYQCMKDFFEFNNKKMMDYFKIESVTRVFVDKNGNLIEENGKSDKVKSDMKNSEIENKVILFKVKMK
ncbi:MAG: hypothetical protein VZQ98_11740 [Bacteroidales bacterium]|nr:hypothetical protein [Bacteroidales bacterium]